MTTFLSPLTEFWAAWGAHVLVGAGGIGVFLLIALFLDARRTKRPLRPIALAISMNLALLLNAEGMWVIATDHQGMNLPRLFAVLVFAVFEICFLTATSLAAEQYRRTTVYAPDGTVVTPGHPGRMLWVAALIAGVSGVIVASNAHSGTERLLRLAVPTVIFLMWWAALTAAGQRARARSRFAYSPRRLAERWGWLIPDEDTDLDAMKAKRQVHRMVVAHQRVSAKRWPLGWWTSRLAKDARTATQPVVDEVLAQLARIDAVMVVLGRTPEAEKSYTGEASEAPIRNGVPQALAARERAVRTAEVRLRRRDRTVQRAVAIRTVHTPRKDPRSVQEKGRVVAAVAGTDRGLSVRDVARLTNLPSSTVQGHWPYRTDAGAVRQTKTNGNVPALEGVTR